MRAFTSLAVAVLAGAVIAWATGLSAGDLPRTPAYLIGTAILLAIGLYGSTYAIDVASARHDRKLILTAVTVGVLVKAALIGSVVALAWQDPLFLLLGVVVAQIDPLSVAALMADERMSPRAKTILAAWSSFDDPITVILTVYVAALTLDTGRTGWASVLVGLAV
ncbi:MAG TPA: cation:proton antiporter, partial [Thiobacillaceae bacterium]